MQQLNVPFYLLFFCCIHFLSCVTCCVLTALKSTLLARRSVASLAASSTPRLSQPAPYSHSNLWAFGWVSCRSDKRLSAWKPHLLPRQQRATYICRTLSPPPRQNNSKAEPVSKFGFAASAQLVLDLCGLFCPRRVRFSRPSRTDEALTDSVFVQFVCQMQISSLKA